MITVNAGYRLVKGAMSTDSSAWRIAAGDPSTKPLRGFAFGTARNDSERKRPYTVKEAELSPKHAALQIRSEATHN